MVKLCDRRRSASACCRNTPQLFRRQHPRLAPDGSGAAQRFVHALAVISGPVRHRGVFSDIDLNVEHGWASYHYQFSRLVVHEMVAAPFGEFFVTQIGMATPPIFALFRGARSGGDAQGRGWSAAVARPDQCDGLADPALFHLAHLSWPRRRQLAGAGPCALRHRRRRRRRAREVERDSFVACLGTCRGVVAAARPGGRGRHRRLSLSASGLWHIAARPRRSDRAGARRRLARARGQAR